jgi:hypothetical protein
MVTGESEDQKQENLNLKFVSWGCKVSFNRPKRYPSLAYQRDNKGQRRETRVICCSSEDSKQQAFVLKT